MASISKCYIFSLVLLPAAILFLIIGTATEYWQTGSISYKTLQHVSMTKSVNFGLFKYDVFVDSFNIDGNAEYNAARAFAIMSILASLFVFPIAIVAARLRATSRDVPTALHLGIPLISLVGTVFMVIAIAVYAGKIKESAVIYYDYQSFKPYAIKLSDFDYGYSFFVFIIGGACLLLGGITNWLNARQQQSYESLQ